MRRKDREVTAFEEKLRILQASQVCRLGMVDESGEPYIVPMNFGWQAEGEQLTLFVHCALSGRKLDILRANPRVCFETDSGHELVRTELPCGYSFRYQSVIGWGKVQILEDHESKAEGLRAIMRHQAGMPDAVFTHEDTKRFYVLRLDVEKLTGKRH